ncbi:MAG: translation initiation factor IF-3, partial [Bacteroidia bacterium]
MVGEGIEPGVYPIRTALDMADEQGLDLVEISPK